MATSLRWSAAFDWKLDYCNADRLTPQQLSEQRRAAEAARESARVVRENTLGARP